MAQREQRRQLRFLQRQVVWLQKVLFGLGKADAARAKAIEVSQEEEVPFALEVDGHTIEVTALRSSIEKRIEELRERMRTLERAL